MSINNLCIPIGAHHVPGHCICERDRAAADNSRAAELPQVLHHHAHLKACCLHGHCEEMHTLIMDIRYVQRSSGCLSQEKSIMAPFKIKVLNGPIILCTVKIFGEKL